MPSNYATPETPRPAPAVRLPFPEARAMVRLLGLRTPTQYRAYLAGRGRDMPKPPAVGALTRYPHIHYRGQGWVGWDDYLGLDLPRVEVPQPPPEAALAAATPESVEAPEPTPISEPPVAPKPVDASPADATPFPAEVSPLLPKPAPAVAPEPVQPDFPPSASDESRRPKPMTFDEARAHVRPLGLRSRAEYYDYRMGWKWNAPKEIRRRVPANPAKAFKGLGWSGWDDYLGISDDAVLGTTPEVTQSRRDALRAFALRYIASSPQRMVELVDSMRMNRPDDVPAFLFDRHKPQLMKALTMGMHIAGSWARFLGMTEQDATLTPGLDEAERQALRDFAIRLGAHLPSRFAALVEQLRASPPPGSPAFIFQIPPKGLVGCLQLVAHRAGGWMRFLGVERVGFAKSREFARSLKLGSMKEWHVYLAGKLAGKPAYPLGMVRHPREHPEFQGAADWLGLEPVEVIPFATIRAFVHTLKLTSKREFESYMRGGMPDKPAWPSGWPRVFDRNTRYAGNGWMGWRDFLGDNTIPSRKPMPFAEAREFMRSQKFPSIAAAAAYIHGKVPLDGRPPLPHNFPLAPQVTYHSKGWLGWVNFLGLPKTHGAPVPGAPSATKFAPFGVAVAFVRDLQLRSAWRWKLYAAGDLPGLPPRPESIPADPKLAYAAEWRGWDYFLKRPLTQVDTPSPGRAARRGKMVAP